MTRRLEPKVLAWLRSGPRTSNQIAILLGITNNHACVTLKRMQRKGLVHAYSPGDCWFNRQRRQTERRQYLRYQLAGPRNPWRGDTRKRPTKPYSMTFDAIYQREWRMGIQRMMDEQAADGAAR